MSSFTQFDFDDFRKRHRIVLAPSVSSAVIPIAKNNNTLETFEKRLEERVAIIEHERQIPHDWALAIAKIQLRAKPKSISEEKWQIITNNAKILLSPVRDIIAHQWTISDIFGCHPIVPEKRFDVMGLLMLLNEGERIMEINKDVIRIQNARGSITGYYRRHDRNCLVEQGYLHEI